MTLQIKIPNQFRLREHQKALWRYLNDEGRRAVAVWHRRAGKDTVSLHWTAYSMVRQPAMYFHMLPTQRQARKVIWNARDKQGRRLIDVAFPKALRARTREDEMLIEFKPTKAGAAGSIWQLVGSDNYDSIVGSNPFGVVFSEYSLTNPAAWDYVRPILAENGGWALFIYTARGRNHGWDLYDSASRAENWFCEKLTIDDTGVIPLSAVEEDRASGMPEELVQQEYWCSFEGGMIGSYYAELMQKAQNEGRICGVPYDPMAPVETWWDIGIDDDTVQWYVQAVGKEIHVIDHVKERGKDASYFVNEIRTRAQQGWHFSTHWLPHDAAAREKGSGDSYEDVVSKLLGEGHGEARVAKVMPIESGINAVRMLLPKCWFDEKRCRKGIDALINYRSEYDETRRVLKRTPVHDWSSHDADAFRTGAVARQTITTRKRSGSTRVRARQAA